MNLQHENGGFDEKPAYEPRSSIGGHKEGGFSGGDPESMVAVSQNRLHTDLKGRHMQMIAMQVQHTEPSSLY